MQMKMPPIQTDVLGSSYCTYDGDIKHTKIVDRHDKMLVQRYVPVCMYLQVECFHFYSTLVTRMSFVFI